MVTNAVEQGKREILEDISNGRVPADVRDFSHLHDFVDANEYGGLTDRAQVAAVQEALNQWLVNGRPERCSPCIPGWGEKARWCKTCGGEIQHYRGGRPAR